MRGNPGRVAWVILLTALVIFFILAAGIPLGIRSYLFNAVEEQSASMQVIEGTVLVERATGSAPSGVRESAELDQGDAVITDANSWATLDLFDRSHVTLYNNAKVRLEESLAPRFALSDRPNRISLNLTGGLMRVGVALAGERPVEFTVVTPHTIVALEEGSYRVEATNEGTQVTVVRGQAMVGQDVSRITIPQGERAWIDLSGQPAAPLPAARNLIENGDFSEPLVTTWVTNTRILRSSATPPTVQAVESDGRRSIRLVRREADDGIHSEASIFQALDQDVRDFVRLQVSLDVLLEFQSLSGGGQLSSEFPVIVRLDYKDRWGNDQFWTHGFYYQNREGYPITLDPWGSPNGEQIPRSVWYPYESGNLLELLGESGPVHVTGLTVYASGWNYDSQVSEIQLIVE
jgi:hypothetical protein